MKKIAIVDDEQDILNILQQFLSRSKKYDIDVFSDPTVALSSVQSGMYDLVLIDIMMPQMNGLDFLEAVKKERSSQKVIMMTAYSTLDKVISANKNGAEDYITKPFVSLRDVENKVLDQLGL